MHTCFWIEDSLAEGIFTFLYSVRSPVMILVVILKLLECSATVDELRLGKRGSTTMGFYSHSLATYIQTVNYRWRNMSPKLRHLAYLYSSVILDYLIRSNQQI